MFGEDDIKELNTLKKTFLQLIDVNLPLIFDIERYQKDFIIAGGVFPSLYHNELIKDIDIFIFNHAGGNFSRLLEAAISDKNLASKFDATKKNDPAYIKALGHDVNGVVETYTFKPLVGPRIQFILTTHATKQDLLKSFDFVHCTMNFYDNNLWISPYVFNTIKNKTLINNRVDVHDWRIDKYKGKGYTYAESLEYTPGKIKVLEQYIKKKGSNEVNSL
jgi:hypothetical protein